MRFIANDHGSLRKHEGTKLIYTALLKMLDVTLLLKFHHEIIYI